MRNQSLHALMIPINTDLSFFRDDIRDAITGAPIASASIDVFNSAGGPADVYTIDDDGREHAIVGSRVTVSALGEVQFYALPGYYQLQLVGTSEFRQIVVLSVSSIGGGGGGNDGWSPIVVVVPDGERRVLQIRGWTGGTGARPATGGYVTRTGTTNAIANAIDIRGNAGERGLPGTTGAAGDDGVDGDTGADGAQGVPGAAGAMGDRGADGAQGVPGTQGVPGAMGVAGDDGVDGDTGADGAQGIPGTAAAQGEDGEDGDTGWSPIIVVSTRGERRVLRVVRWTGGTGTSPHLGFLSANGLIPDASEAIDIRGAAGADGTDGTDATESLTEFSIANLLHMHEQTTSDSLFLVRELTVDASPETPHTTNYRIAFYSIGTNVSQAVTAGSHLNFNFTLADFQLRVGNYSHYEFSAYVASSIAQDTPLSEIVPITGAQLSAGGEFVLEILPRSTLPRIVFIMIRVVARTSEELEFRIRVRNQHLQTHGILLEAVETVAERQARAALGGTVQRNEAGLDAVNLRVDDQRTLPPGGNAGSVLTTDGAGSYGWRAPPAALSDAFNPATLRHWQPTQPTLTTASNVRSLVTAYTNRDDFAQVGVITSWIATDFGGLEPYVTADSARLNLSIRRRGAIPAGLSLAVRAFATFSDSTPSVPISILVVGERNATLSTQIDFSVDLNSIVEFPANAAGITVYLYARTSGSNGSITVSAVRAELIGIGLVESQIPPHESIAISDSVIPVPLPSSTTLPHSIDIEGIGGLEKSEVIGLLITYTHFNANTQTQIWTSLHIGQHYDTYGTEIEFRIIDNDRVTITHLSPNYTIIDISTLSRVAGGGLGLTPREVRTIAASASVGAIEEWARLDEGASNSLIIPQSKLPPAAGGGLPPAGGRLRLLGTVASRRFGSTPFITDIPLPDFTDWTDRDFGLIISLSSDDATIRGVQSPVFKVFDLRYALTAGNYNGTQVLTGASQEIRYSFLAISGNDNLIMIARIVRGRSATNSLPFNLYRYTI